MPARSLIKFKSVSRQWRSLISGARFSLDHVRCNPKPSVSGLYYFWDETRIPLQGHALPRLTFTGRPTHRSSRIFDFKIHDSQHGLILCSYYSSNDNPRIVVCNPTTQKHRVFHQRALNLGGYMPFTNFYLQFDPSVSVVYKLIWIRDKGSHYEINICASNCSIWKTISVESQQSWDRLLVQGLLSSDQIIYMLTEKWYLIQFNIKTEKLSGALTTLKPKARRCQHVGYFGERAGCYFVLIAYQKSGLDFKIYEMEKLEGSNWVLKHHIDFTEELRNFPLLERPILRKHFAVLRVFWDGENEEGDLTFVMAVPEKAISYNLYNRSIKVICDMPGHKSFGWAIAYINVHPFIGSLCAV